MLAGLILLLVLDVFFIYGVTMYTYYIVSMAKVLNPKEKNFKVTM